MNAPAFKPALLKTWAVPVPAMQAFLVRGRLPRHGMHPEVASCRSMRNVSRTALPVP